MANRRTLRSAYPRVRRTGTVTRPTVTNTFHAFGSSSGTYVDSSVTANAGYTGSIGVCFDVVTPDFATRVAAGEVINNPFSSIKCTCAYGGSGSVVTYIASIPPWPAGQNQTATWNSSMLQFNPEFALPPLVDSSGDLYVPASIVDVPYLLARAKTGALAKVDQSKAQVMVGIAELRQTLLGIVNPLQGINGFLSRFQFHPKGRYNFRTKKLNAVNVKQGSGLLPSVANQYLSFYYGLLPFMRDIESYIEAYLLESLDKKRETARSGFSDEQVEIRNVYGNPLIEKSQYTNRYTRTDSVQVRTGTMYEPTANSYQKLLGLRAMDFFGSAYQAMPWSFFLDYFSNLGRLIEALTPRTGVTYLASWETFVYRMEWRAETLTSFHPGSTYTHSRAGTEWATRVIEARVRSPCSPYSNVRPVAFAGTWEDKAKVGAVLSLLTQQLAKKIPILNF